MVGASTPPRPGARSEWVALDFSDAYCHLMVHPSELRNCLVAKPPPPGRPRKRSRRPTVGLMLRMGFGSKGAPLTWSRVAAALGRMGQATLEAAQEVEQTPGQLNLYLDDPLIFLTGLDNERNEQLLVLLGLWTACGFRLAWHKASRGSFIEWIGLLFEIHEDTQSIFVKIPAEYIKDIVEEAQALLALAMIPVARLRRFAGRCGWVMNLVPRAQWTVQRLWAALKDARARRGHQRGLAQQRRRGGDHHSLVYAKQVAPPLRWISAFWGQPDLRLERRFYRAQAYSPFELVLDASPWGLGGYLATAQSGTPLQYFADELTAEDEQRMGAAIGKSDGQQAWEALCVLCAIRLWLPLLADQRIVLRVRSDSMVAISLLVKLASSSPVLNGIGAELAFSLESVQAQDVVAAHIPGSLNRCADLLSRMFQPGACTKPPQALAQAKRRTLPKRDASFYKVWHVAVMP